MSRRVLIIGSGIIGAAFAFHLAKRGADVRVLDAGTDIGGVATPNSWGWINAGPGHAPDYVSLRHESMRQWRELDKSIAGLTVNWCGGLAWNLPEADLISYAALRSAQGYAARVVDQKDVLRLEPDLRSPPRIAVHAAGEGCVEPVHAVEKMLAAARALGADVLQGVAVRWLVVEGGRVRGVMTHDGMVEAEVVVLAAGAGAVGLLKDAGVALALDESPGLLVHSAPAPEFLNGLVVAPELHVRQRADGCLVAGADFGGMDPGVDAEAAADELFAKVQQFLKGGEALKRARLSVGYRPLPRDGRPATGMIPSVEGLYLCVSHSGITLAPALAAFGASEILGQGRHGLLGPFSPNRLVSVI